MGTKISIEELYERDNGMCGICGKRVTRRQLLAGLANRDHIVPASLGGTNHRTNLRLAHYACNIRRGNDLPNNGQPSYEEKRQTAYDKQNGLCGLCGNEFDELVWEEIAFERGALLCHRICIQRKRQPHSLTD
jgi:5-methylcytosine-specific restriction endonuclease McrA